MTTAEQLAALSERYRLDAVHAFGSRAAEVAAFVRGLGPIDATIASDVDVGVLPTSGRHLYADDRARLTVELERLFGTPRVDVVVLPEAAPYLALDIIEGELLDVRDRVRLARYELYVLRRAGDLAPHERERRRLVLTGGR
jgi:predicted nucleotidyltransferase